MSPKHSSSVRSNGTAWVLTDSRYSLSLERGLAILECFSPDRPLLGILEMAEALNMTSPTTHRYASTLAILGLLEQPRDGGRKYQLGSKVSDLGMAALNCFWLRPLAHPYLEELRRQASYTVSIAILRDDEVMIVDRLPGFRGYAGLGLNIGLGSRLPAYCTSMGKLLLAHLSPDERATTLRSVRLTKRGPNTIVKKPMLLNELARIQETGYSINDEELSRGVRSIAMPVLSRGTVMAAVDIAAPTSMVSRSALIYSLRPLLLRATKALSSGLLDVDGATMRHVQPPSQRNSPAARRNPQRNQ